MYDRIVRILEIWHVLEIKKNLIFFSLLGFSRLWLFY
jgi:hypothetical protein